MKTISERAEEAVTVVVRDGYRLVLIGHQEAVNCGAGDHDGVAKYAERAAYVEALRIATAARIAVDFIDARADQVAREAVETVAVMRERAGIPALNKFRIQWSDPVEAQNDGACLLCHAPFDKGTKVIGGMMTEYGSAAGSLPRWVGRCIECPASEPDRACAACDNLPIPEGARDGARHDCGACGRRSVFNEEESRWERWNEPAPREAPVTCACRHAPNHVGPLDAALGCPCGPSCPCIADEAPVCNRCNDSHQMEREEGRSAVPCTYCPTPCRECASDEGRGAYCGTPRCGCACHRKAQRAATMQGHFDAAEVLLLECDAILRHFASNDGAIAYRFARNMAEGIERLAREVERLTEERNGIAQAGEKFYRKYTSEAATLRARAAEHVSTINGLAARLDETAAFGARQSDLARKTADERDAFQKRVAELEACRRAYASEFPPGADGEPDTGSIHENIRRLKAERATLDARLLDAVQSVPTSAQGKE